MFRVLLANDYYVSTDIYDGIYDNGSRMLGTSAIYSH